MKTKPLGKSDKVESKCKCIYKLMNLTIILLFYVLDNFVWHSVLLVILHNEMNWLDMNKI